jgi:hypothetical protein
MYAETPNSNQSERQIETKNTMKAIELETEITADHAIHLKLPNQVRPGRARVIVLYETDDDTKRQIKRKGGKLDDFLAALPGNTPGRDREEIAAQVEAERASWD